jgi:dTDP-4-amino-4,6-dideoxygalactose transaminase
MKVPLLDLKAQLKSIENEIKSAVARVIEGTEYILGPEVGAFEQEAARYLGVAHAVGLASGTDALVLALKALSIGPGDEVITTSYSFFATAEAIVNVGATPVFVDIDRATYNINPNLIEQKITNRTKAIMPVHLFGQCADLSAIMDLADRRRIPIIEDAAQAFGAEYKQRKAGTIGTLGCFSFFPSKNLGGIGDGGMVATNDAALAEKIKTLRAHGAQQKYTHTLVGTNSRLDTIQAAVLLVKIKYLNQWNEARRARAQIYTKAFSALADITPPYEAYNNYHIYNQYVVRLSEKPAARNPLIGHLREHDISCVIYYPIPLHLQPGLASLNYQAGDLPESEAAARETLALPIYPELTREEQGCVIQKIEQFFISHRIKQSVFGFAF